MNIAPHLTAAQLKAALFALILGMLAMPCRRAVAVPPDVSSFSVSPSTLTFPSANPSVTSVAATENPITISAHLMNANNATLTVIAGGDLVSGSDTIPISKITWTTTSPGFVGGTLSKSSQVTVASGPTGSANVTFAGNLNFYFANSWTYATGSYIQTITFTATAL